MSTYVYKYSHSDYEWLYVGKADNSVAQRVYGHSKESKFQPFLDKVKIYYIELDNKAQSKFVESYLIDKYKPHLNRTDKYEGESPFELNLPQWKLYDSLIHNNSSQPLMENTWDKKRKSEIEKLERKYKSEISNLNFELKKQKEKYETIFKVYESQKELTEYYKKDAEKSKDILLNLNDRYETSIEIHKKHLESSYSRELDLYKSKYESEKHNREHYSEMYSKLLKIYNEYLDNEIKKKEKENITKDICKLFDDDIFNNIFDEDIFDKLKIKTEQIMSSNITINKKNTDSQKQEREVTKTKKRWWQPKRKAI